MFKVILNTTQLTCKCKRNIWTNKRPAGNRNWFARLCNISINVCLMQHFTTKVTLQFLSDDLSFNNCMLPKLQRCVFSVLSSDWMVFTVSTEASHHTSSHRMKCVLFVFTATEQDFLFAPFSKPSRKAPLILWKSSCFIAKRMKIKAICKEI